MAKGKPLTHSARGEQRRQPGLRKRFLKASSSSSSSTNIDRHSTAGDHFSPGPGGRTSSATGASFESPRTDPIRSKISSTAAVRSRLTMSGVVLSMGGGGAGAEDEDDVANLLQGDDYDGDG